MSVTVPDWLDSVASELQISQNELISQGVRMLLENKLLEIEGEVFLLHGKYTISSVFEMEARYETGSLEEDGSWQDFQRLDTLEYKRDRLRELLEQIDF